MISTLKTKTGQTLYVLLSPSGRLLSVSLNGRTMSLSDARSIARQADTCNDARYLEYLARFPYCDDPRR